MSKYIYKSLLMYAVSAMALIATSCDDGNIKEDNKITYKEGYVVKMTGSLKNISSWSNLDKNYSLVIAGFAEGDSFPTISKLIPTTSTDSISVVLSGMENTISTIELCAINSIYKRVVSYDTIFSFSDNADWDPRDTIYYEADGLDVSVYSGLYNKLIAGKGKCYRCHGATKGAANLHLAGKETSYSELVGVESTTISGLKRVAPKDVENSVLYRIATEDASTLPIYPHVGNVDGLDYNNQKLIKDWINGGARED